MAEWRDFIGLWIMSEREARNAAVSWMRVSLGGGMREELPPVGTSPEFGRRVIPDMGTAYEEGGWLLSTVEVKVHNEAVVGVARGGVWERSGELLN